MGENKINHARKRCFYTGAVKVMKLSLCVITKPRRFISSSGQFAAYLKRKSFGYPLDMRLGGPQRCFGYGSGNKLLPSQQTILAK
jgi:hypothetical protein